MLLKDYNHNNLAYFSNEHKLYSFDLDEELLYSKLSSDEICQVCQSAYGQNEFMFHSSTKCICFTCYTFFFKLMMTENNNIVDE